ncbi:hypothetical protein U1Q18_006501 [Sarracenia purpurea var. burkii]
MSLITMVKEKRQIGPVLLKFGVALALSLGGILYSILRAKRIRPSEPPRPRPRPRPPPPPQVLGNQLDTGGGKALMKNDHHARDTTSASSNSASIAPEKYEDPCIHKASSANSLSGLSASSKYSGGERDELLLPEFNELVKGFDLAAAKAGFSPKKEAETPHSDTETSKTFKHGEENDHEQEIKNLRNTVRILRDRERNLEIQLLEYCGLKEQETAVMELQNRLKINSMEAKLYSLKIESLQADNRRLESQVADYAKVVAELEAARGKIKVLKKKLKSETEHNKEQILNLQQRVKKLLIEEQEIVANDQDVRLKMQRMKDLEEEAEELRNSNHSMRLENAELARKLEYTQVLATCVLEDEEAEALRGEAQRLRQQNEHLSKEIEQLQADRCAEVEELVYLRWINACLRYELRNYQPRHGKTTARDLSKTLSPKSEEKAKQLIVEYANKEGVSERGMNITDSDLDRWSSSHSYATDSGEFEDSPVDNSNSSSANKSDTTTRKTKFFSKLMKLIRGKDSRVGSRSSSLERTASADDMMCSWSVSSSIDSRNGRQGKFKSLSLGSARSSVDLGRLKSLKEEDVRDSGGSSERGNVGSSDPYKNVLLGRKSVGDSSREKLVSENPEGSIQKSELVKFAQVLMDSSGEERLKLPRRSTSFNSSIV